MRRGDVYLASLAPRSGSEPGGRRPVVVVSTDSFNRVEGPSRKNRYIRGQLHPAHAARPERHDPRGSHRPDRGAWIGRIRALGVSACFVTNPKGWRSVVVVPVSTSSRQCDRGPTAVPVPGGEAGLARPSVALCHQVTTLDRSKLGRRLGRLSDSGLRLVGLGLRAALDLL